jgi:hypothetical protein
MKKNAKNPYAIGMSIAKKLKKDEPPLEKSTVVKAHDIAKGIMKGDKKPAKSKKKVKKLKEAGATLRKYIPGLGKMQAASRASSRKHAANFVRSAVPNPDQDSLVRKHERNAQRYRKLAANESQLNELSPEKYGHVSTAAKNRIIDLKRALASAEKIGDKESAKRYADAIAHYEGLANKTSEKHATGISQRKLGIAKSRGTKLLPSRLRQTVTTEAERPLDGDQLGPGSHSGRGNVLESKTKKRINENMNTCEAAYHEGKSHGLSKHNYACKYNEGSEEHRRYHRGYIEGLDECYGLQPNRGLVDETVDDMTETASYMDDNDLPEITDDDLVDDMASYGAHDDDMLDEMHTELDEVSRGEWMRQKDREAEKAGKGSFSAFGQTFNTADIDEAFTFESLERQLNALLKEDAGVTEGLSVSMSQGLSGLNGQGNDTVSVTATDDDASKLLGFMKQVGLGGFGDEKSGDQPSAIVSVSDYGAPAYNGHDDMKNMMVKMSGEDYEEEESEEGEQHHHQPEVCTECGMNETKCQCDEEVVETETQDQETEQVAEDDGEGYEQGQEAEAQIDSALAVGSENEEQVDEMFFFPDKRSRDQKSRDRNEPTDVLGNRPKHGIAKHGNEYKDIVKGKNQAGEELPQDYRDRFKLGKPKGELPESKDKESAMKDPNSAVDYAINVLRARWPEAEKVIATDPKARERYERVVLKGKMSDSKKPSEEFVLPLWLQNDTWGQFEAALNEWANEAGKDGTEASFQRDIDFMTKVISGGLNKPKSTGQQTIPVLAQDKKRTVDHLDEWMKLSGVKK